MKKLNAEQGLHGMKYEINLISYYLIKAYKSNENFQLSNGKEGTLKLDDIILESESLPKQSTQTTKRKKSRRTNYLEHLENAVYKFT